MGTSEGLLHALDRLPPWAWALPVLLVLVYGIRTGIRLSRWILARRPARSRRLGAAGARRAIALLERKGWTVLETEVVREGVVEVDGKPETFVVRVDALVTRRGHVFVAEAKGGFLSATIRHRGTRRQLLEYAHVFGADGVLLVEARRGLVRVVRFPRPVERAAPGTRR